MVYFWTTKAQHIQFRATAMKLLPGDNDFYGCIFVLIIWHQLKAQPQEKLVKTTEHYYNQV